MAERLDNYEFRFMRKAAMADWARWADGQVWRLKRGIDWPDEHSANAARESFRTFCRKILKTGARTNVLDHNTIIVQAQVPPAGVATPSPNTPPPATLAFRGEAVLQ